MKTYAPLVMCDFQGGHWVDTQPKMVPYKSGGWVPADVARRLYDALNDTLEWEERPAIIKEARAALAAADGED